MQPHSMCALALAAYIWGKKYERINVSKCVMRVELRSSSGKLRTLIYDLEDVRESTDKKELKISIKRAGGGLACTVIVARRSLDEGSEVTMTHETNHISGLREVCNLWATAVKSGRHYNSLKYRNFSGEFRSSDKKVLMLDCERVKPDGTIYTTRYDLERSQLILSE